MTDFKKMTGTQSQSVLNAISVMKSIMLMLVVVGHSCIVYKCENWGGVVPDAPCVPLSVLVSWLATFHTWFFVFASGFLFGYGRYSSCKYRNFKLDFCKRFRRLVVPYCFFAMFWAGPADYFIKGSDLHVVVLNYVFCFDCAQLWFLIMLFFVWLLFYVFSDVIVKLDFWFACLVFVALRLLCIVLKDFHVPLWILGVNNVMRYSLLYYIGMYVALHPNVNIVMKKMLIPFILIEICAFVLYCVYNTSWVHLCPCLDKVLYVLLNVTGVCMFYSASLRLNCVIISKNPLMRLLAVHGMGVYLVHQQIIYLLLHSVNLSVVNPYLFSVCCFMFSVSFSLLFVYVLAKTRLGRFALGYV